MYDEGFLLFFFVATIECPCPCIVRRQFVSVCVEDAWDEVRSFVSRLVMLLTVC